MERTRAWLRRNPTAVDAGIAVLVALASVPSVAVSGVGPGGWLWFGTLHLPLVWRRRAPVAVFWVTYGLALGAATLLGSFLLIGELPREGAYTVIATLVALYAVARYAPRRQLWPAVAAAAAPLGLGWLLGGVPPEDLVTIGAFLAATVLLGVTVGTRRAYLDALRERAERLERERDQQARLAAAAERARIARELHDIVAHNVTVMVALADGAEATAPTDPERAAGAMRAVSSTGREALGELRRLVGLLREDGTPATGALVPPPGLDDLDELVDQVRAAGVRVELTREGERGDWSQGAGLAVYRIVQEALTNTLKHAGPAASARVRLCYTPAGVELEVADDGPERPAAAARPGRPDGGHGLAGMAERAASYGGRVEAGPRPGAGWLVKASLRLDGGEVAG